MNTGGPVSGKRFNVLWAGLLAVCLVLTGFVAFRVQQSLTRRNAAAVEVVQHGHHTSTQDLQRAPSGASPAAAALPRCEARIENGPRTAPVMAIVGASYTAGVGPDNPEQSWAVDLARLMRWNAVIYGVSGAGYVQPAKAGLGPMSRMLGVERLGALRPALVLIQAGHDDQGVGAALEGARVADTLGQLQAEAPAARIGLITTFAGPRGASPGLRATDQAIVDAGSAAFPGAIIMDPLAGGWNYAHAHGGLHPTAAGDAQIARTVAAALAAHGIEPAPATASSAPTICDVAIGVAKPVAA